MQSAPALVTKLCRKSFGPSGPTSTSIFGAVGGFSTRHDTNRFVTVLPYSDVSTVGQIMVDFAEDFRRNGISSLESLAMKRGSSKECAEFVILA
jgi:hypothetical protein